jgi:hypothetical protein
MENSHNFTQSFFLGYTYCISMTYPGASLRDPELREGKNPILKTRGDRHHFYFPTSQIWRESRCDKEYIGSLF